MKTRYFAKPAKYRKQSNSSGHLIRRTAALLLCVCLAASMLPGFGSLLSMNAQAAGRAGPTQGVRRQADASTMDTYQDILDFHENTRYAGRLWADKSVFAYGSGDTGNRATLWDANANVLHLQPSVDGVTGEITLDDDFLHAYSILGSSQQIIGVPPVRTVIVFDNSATMYDSSSGAWSDQRIALTIEAINRAIDALMSTSVYNEVAVVLFGDGQNSGSTTAGTYRYLGNESAVTILPMKHYEPYEAVKADYQSHGASSNYTPYLKGGWNKSGDIPDGDNLHNETTKYGTGGWVFVDNMLCGLTSGSVGAEDDWKDTGFNGCGSNHYTCYVNGPTNIQSGYYVGMQELLKADKTVTVGTVTYQCMPSLVMLTDGMATDMMSGTYITADTASSGYPENNGFVNDTGNRLRAFLGYDYSNNNKDIRNFWDMFVHQVGGKYESVATEYGKSEVNQNAIPTGAGATAMEDVARTYSDSVASMLLGTLMTTAYYKEAVREAYQLGQDEDGNDIDWSIYTISVDMLDINTLDDGVAQAAKSGTNTDPTSELPLNWQYGITSSAPTMDPSSFFYKNGELNLQWLQDKGYIDDGVDMTAIFDTPDLVLTHTAYPDYSVGEMIIHGIVKAAAYLKKWSTEGSFVTDYQSWSEAKNILKKDGTYWSDWNQTKYCNQYSHGNGYLLKEKKTISWPDIGDDDPNHVTKAELLKNIGYNADAYYASTASGAAGDLTQVFTTIMNDIIKPLFTPVSGGNDLGVDNDSITYMDPIGKYMTVKDVKSLVLFGKLYNLTKTAVYSYEWNNLYMQNREAGGGPFPMGWYKGAPTEEGNDGVSYGGQGATPEGYDDTERAWADGWVYRLDSATASKFVPSLKTIDDVSNSDPKQRKTSYTFYRIESDETGKQLGESDRQTLHMNPTYGTDDDIKSNVHYDDSGNSGHLKSQSGVYALADLRIWVEDTGDYTDPNIGESGSESDDNFDEALYVNVPVNMLPMRIITVNLGNSVNSSGTEWTYTTNLPEAGAAIEPNSVLSASFPLRVFYTVGISDDLLTSDGSIDLAAGVSPEYMQDNRVRNADWAKARNLDQGVVEFFSNWYNPENRYDAYAITNNEYSYGDPMVTFSPSTENRYYIFEKSLPLYQTAYVWVKSEERWRQVRIGEDLTEEELEDARTFDAINFDATLIATDLEAETSSVSGSAAQNTANINAALQARGIDISALEDGVMVLLKNHLLTDVTRPTDEQLESGEKTDPFPSDRYFFLAIEYYTLNSASSTAKMGKCIIARKGAEFGSAYHASGITNGDMLVWHDTTGKYPDYPYLSYTETKNHSRGKDFIGVPLDTSTGYYLGYDQKSHAIPDQDKLTEIENYDPEMKGNGNWVVSAKQGGLRVGGLAQSLTTKAKDGESPVSYPEYAAERFPDKLDFSVSYYGGNVTRTANNVYVPTISTTSDAMKNDIIVNIYMGNNGRLWMEDTTLLLTKTLETQGDIISGDANKKFDFQVYLQDKTGPVTAVRVRYNEASGVWQRQIHAIDMELDAHLFLQINDGKKAIVDKDGCRLTSSTETADGETVITYAYQEACQAADGTRHAAGDPYPVAGEANYDPNGPYYVYIGSPDQAGIGGKDTSLRVYHNRFCKMTDEAVSGELIKVKYDTGAEEGGGSQWADGGTLPATFSGKREFYAAKVELFSVSKVDTVLISNTLWERESAGEPDLTLSTFYLATLDPSTSAAEGSSAVSVTSPYRTMSEYLTEVVYLGYRADGLVFSEDGVFDETASAKLTAEDLYIPSGTAVNPDADKAPWEHTAEVKLESGWGLLFSSMDSGTNYGFAEKLSDLSLEEGYQFSRAEQIQQETATEKGKDGSQHIEDQHIYYVSGDTGAKEEEVHYFNTVEPEVLVLSKTLVDMHGDATPAPPDLEFTFTIKFTPPEDGTITSSERIHYWRGGIENLSEAPKRNSYDEIAALPNTLEVKKAEDEEAYLATLTLRANEAAVLYDLIAGTDYTVTEARNESYPAVDPEHRTEVGEFYTQSGKIRRAHDDPAAEAPSGSPNRVDFYDLLPTGSLAIEKQVDATTPDDTVEFTFQITLTPPPGKELDTSKLAITREKIDSSEKWIAVPIWSSNGTGWYATVTLHHNERLTINGLPFGTSYAVSEAEQDHYNLERVEDGVTNKPLDVVAPSGTVTETQPMAYLRFVNGRTSTPPVTGGAGVWLFWICGAALLLLAGLELLFLLRKRPYRK